MFEEIYEKEFGVRDVLTKTWLVYCKRFKAISTMMLIVYLPGIIIGCIMMEYAAKINNLSDSAKVTLLILAIVMILAMIVVAFISFLGISLIVEDTVKEDGNKINWETVLNKVFSKLPSYIGTNLLATLILFGLSLLFVIPGIIWNLYYIFITQVVFLREIGGKDALDYSKSLVKGRWWKVFWILVVIGLINMAVSFGTGVISFFLPGIFQAILTTCVDAIACVFFIACQTILFLNLDYLNKKNKNATMELDGDLEKEPQEIVIR